jgi:hypothetical protein
MESFTHHEKPIEPFDSSDINEEPPEHHTTNNKKSNPQHHHAPTRSEAYKTIESLLKNKSEPSEHSPKQSLPRQK